MARRQEPGALGFAGMMAAETVWSGTYVVALLVHDPAARTVLENVKWFGTCVYLFLLLFALEYTGHDEFATRRILGLLSLPWIASVGLIWTQQWHDLWWSTSLMEIHGLAILQFSYGPGFLAHTLYSYVIILLASALLLRLVFVSDYLYADQSALLVFGILAPVGFNVADIALLEPGAVVDLTPVAFTVSGLAFGYALFRHRLFDLVPATRRLGRNAAIGQLETGIVIVDTAHRVVYCNAAAEPVLGREPADALDEPLRSLVDVDEVDFDAPDGLAEIERDGTVYEVRTSPITDRHDRTIGHTLVAHDVTARKRRERALAAQRDELETLSALNVLIRGVVQALVSENERDGIERAVCDRIVEGDLYHTACVGDVQTWNGEAERWTVAGSSSGADAPSVDTEKLDVTEGPTVEGGADVDRPAASGAGTTSVSDGAGSAGAHLPAVSEDAHTWVVVPIVYGRTVFGAIGLATDRDTVSARERSVLGELGEAVGHAMNAVSTRQLLSTEAVVEVEFESTTDADALVAATAGTDCELELAGVVPAGDRSTLAYVRVDGDVTAAENALADATEGEVRSIRGDDSGGLLEWRVSGADLLGAVVDQGAQLRSFEASDGRVDYRAEVASDDAVRSLLDSLDGRFGGVRLLAKRERASSIEDSAALPADGIDDLTDRQQEAIEAAYRAGYFDWPRESTAEEVASAMEIAPSTLHSHLRKAEGTLLASLFESGPDDQ
ncbi:GAF/PAS/PAC domain-containing protein [Salinarchaeum sp. Harcht-Bsk1]|nr:GAF/PAS/PAC domain-containing protein [Salinarchaeum sp. Harcht-Bsk1]